MAGFFPGKRGEYANHPAVMPWVAWRQVVRRVFGAVSTDNINIAAAGVAFYLFLSLVPALAAMVMLYGLVADAATVTEQAAFLKQVMPQAAFDIVEQQLETLRSESDGTLTFGLVFSLALTLWSTTKGMKALMVALNIAYDEKESRGLIRQNVTALAFSFCAVVFVMTALGLIAALPPLFEFTNLPVWLETLLAFVRWVVLGLIVSVGFALLYRFGPHRSRARWKWVFPGALLGTLLWLAGSILFSVYVSRFGSYNEVFGSLAAVVVLLFWLYLTAYVVCLGAELNAQLELQTYRDSTEGPPRMRGTRGAYVADNVAVEKPSAGKS